MAKDDTAAAAAAETAEELPRTIVRRVVKERLSEISGDGGDVTLHKEALIAFSESARIFIHYLAATAHDICTESRRQIINADDVLKALEEIEFPEFVEPLGVALEELRKKNAGKRAAAAAAKTKEVDKKQKTDKEVSTENGVDNEDKEDDEDKEGDEDKGDDEDNEVKGDDEEREDGEDNEGGEENDDDDEENEDGEENGDNNEEQASEENDDENDTSD